MARRIPRKAWVVRWEWAIPSAAVERPIAAVLPYRLGEKELRRIVEILYASYTYEPNEMLEASRAKGHNPYRASLGSVSVNVDGEMRQIPWSGEVICGHDPWLTARTATVWASPDSPGGIVYDELLGSGETQRRSLASPSHCEE